MTKRMYWPAAAGVGSGVMMLTGVIILNSNIPDDSGSRGLAKTLTFYLKSSNLDLLEATTLLLLASSMLFLFFLGALTGIAGKRSQLVLAGGIAFAVLMMAAALISGIFAISAKYDDTFLVVAGTALLAMLLIDLAYGAFIGAMAAAAVLLFAMWRVSRTTDALPQWLGWPALVIALGSLAGPFTAWITTLLMGVWILAAGVLLTLRPPAAAAERPTTAPAEPSVAPTEPPKVPSGPLT
ncbi:hypothetical protein GCM10022403_030380 [Streptomyces coacervatus]|uniref:DUF4386 family protein n=1 Tax=Streptomyces coacervatus TaxID=647381 RepID=A0ABP7HMJ4_9ACTN|nr:hypothetical protein [Streptomyces coacervatus]MDF2271468.1 hypothetical protein [Streptomyces coacervatus]